MSRWPSVKAKPTAHQPDDGGLVGEDADHVAADAAKRPSRSTSFNHFEYFISVNRCLTVGGMRSAADVQQVQAAFSH
jgi:hypothetical protein